ncbi:MAG: pyrroline-5-carboxylate reductase [Gammaproteobacteria bacterium]|nr:pyrroline-5-carboxylate reductase [Gammaproteobacteria bacterium]MBD3776008.1 pyrroline-5-carboxylate reductase [Thiotrichales bacterium]
MQATLCFIGGGNMAKSLIGGLIASGYPQAKIIASDPTELQRHSLTQTFGIHCYADNNKAVQLADIVILAVKPQVLQTVCKNIAATVQQTEALMVSVAAGIRTTDIDRWLGGDMAIVRTMPNTPSLIQSGAAGLFANQKVSASQRDEAEHIMRAAGLTIWVDEESQLDAVTALSGSGPAYYFLFMEAMENAAQQMGLDAKTAHLLTMQTALGAAKMVMESTDDCQTLRKNVTSPNGTTEQAIKTFEQAGLRGIVAQAMQAARNRAEELANELGGEI